MDVFEIRLRPAWQIDLKARMAEIDDARSECIEAPAWHLRRKATLDKRGQQMVAGRNVQAGPVGEFSQRRLAAGFGDGLQQKQSAVDGLNAVTVTVPRARRPRFGTRARQDCCVHWSFLPSRQGKILGQGESRLFQHKERGFQDIKQPSLCFYIETS